MRSQLQIFDDVNSIAQHQVEMACIYTSLKYSTVHAALTSNRPPVIRIVHPTPISRYTSVHKSHALHPARQTL